MPLDLPWSDWMYWGLENMVDISQITFSNSFTCMKMFAFSFILHRNLFWLSSWHYESTLVQVMIWCHTGNKPLPEPMLTLMYGVTGLKWVCILTWIHSLHGISSDGMMCLIYSHMLVLAHILPTQITEIISLCHHDECSYCRQWNWEHFLDWKPVKCSTILIGCYATGSYNSKSALV